MNAPIQPGEPFQSTVETIGSPRPSRWRMAAAAVTGSVALLGVATGIGYAAAGSSAGASSADSTTTTTAPSKGAPNAADRAKAETDRLNKVLQPLVDKGTITASQRDAIVAALVAAKPEGGGRGGRGGPGGMKGVIGLFGADADAAAKAIGISTDDLKKAVMGGQSMADVAKAHGVDPQKVIDALVAATKAQQAAHPRPNGAIGSTDAEITQRITAIVNGTLPKFGGAGFGHGGRGGPGGGWGGPNGGPGSPGTSAPTTTAPAATPPTTAPESTTTAPESTTTAPTTTVPETSTTTS